MQEYRPRMPFEFPYGTPDSLNFIPSNPYASAPSAQQSFTNSAKDPTKHTTDPIVTGTSVLAIRYKDGVMICADTLASYGSMARFRTVERIAKIGAHTIIGATGEYSDFQYLLKILDELITENDLKQDGCSLSPQAIHSYITRLLYNRRNNFNPLWGQFIVAGYENNTVTLGLADLRGTSFVDNHLATGYGAHIARPLIRKAWRADLTEAEAKKLLEDCMLVLYYRDARSYNRIQMARVTAEGVAISPQYSLETDWSVGTKSYPLDPEVRNLPNV